MRADEPIPKCEALALARLGQTDEAVGATGPGALGSMELE
jgi:hypothetical protein